MVVSNRAPQQYSRDDASAVLSRYSISMATYRDLNRQDYCLNRAKATSRRTGLNQSSFQGAHLIKTIKNPNSKLKEQMPTKDAVERNRASFSDDELAIAREPVSSDSEQENAADITKTNFSAKEVPKAEATQKRARARGNGRKNGGGIIAPGHQMRGSQSSEESPKRKSEEAGLGAGLEAVMAFDGTHDRKRAKKKITTFGSKTSSQSSQPRGSQPKSSQGTMYGVLSPQKTDTLELEKKAEVEPVSKGLPAVPASKSYNDLDFSDNETDELRAFKPPAKLDYSPQKRSVNVLKFNQPDMDIGDSPAKPAVETAAFKTSNLDDSFEDDSGMMHEDVAAIDLADGIANVAGGQPAQRTTTFEEDFPSMAQRARCPMCDEPVNPNDLKGKGYMTIRQQEEFCQSHQMKTAQDNWEERNYPTIDWDKLESRIAKHHSFIKKLVNGQDCHHRQLLAGAVKTGQDRNLLKSTSNITPGYYGSRGLRAISECIMEKFTPLLKKRAGTDRLMSARTVSGFVQSVLVPEVTVLLIKEDMGVESDEEARKILLESMEMGGMIHEEIEDVVDLEDSDVEEKDED